MAIYDALPYPNPDDVCSSLEYDEQSGRVKWMSKGPVGAYAGTSSPYGTRISWRVGRRRQKLRAENVVWLLNFGEWPLSPIRFVDGDPNNTRIENLSLVDMRPRLTRRKGILPLPSTLRLVLSYLHHPETGFIHHRDGRDFGAVACFSKKPYRAIIIDGRQYLAHRVVYKIRYGTDPDCIDHVSGPTDLNTINNLRHVSHRENICNSARSVANTSGALGVSQNKVNGKWKASITVDGKTISLGHYRSFDDAVAARKCADQRYGFHPNHGRPPNLGAAIGQK